MAQARQNLQQPAIDPAQADKDAAVMIGGPGQEDQVAQQQADVHSAPAAREVTINGKKFQVDPDLYETLEARNRDFDRTLNEKLSQRDREIQELRGFKQRFEAVVKPEQDQPKGYDTLLFENPTEAVRRIKEEVRNEVTGLYVQDQSQRRFWDTFYKGNPDLDPLDDDFMVKAVLQQNYDTLAGKRPDDAAKELADLTRRQILRLSQKQRIESEDEQRPTSRTVVEPASRSTPRAAPREAEGPTSLSEVIRNRRKARMGKTAA